MALLLALMGGAWLVQRPMPAPAEPQRLSLYVFGSLSEIRIAHADATRAAGALAEIERRLNLRHREWHPWQPGELMALNEALARGEPHLTSASIAHLIEVSLPLVEASDGLFDPGIGGLVALWGFHTDDYPIVRPPPAPEAITRWREAAPTLRELRLHGRTVSCDNRALRLDFNAIAEGAAALEIAAVLRSHQLADTLISLGGDLYALGAPDGRPWRVALRAPEGGVLASTALHDGEALFSSGVYNRYRVTDGARQPHLLDPRTGEPARGASAAAVLTRDPLRADAAATALMVAGPAEWLTVVRHMALRCALIVDEEGTVHVTAALRERLQFTDASRPLRVSGEPGNCD